MLKMTMLTDNPTIDEATELDDDLSIPDQVLAQARELDDLRSAIKVLDKRQKVLRAALLEHLNEQDADVITDGTVSIARTVHNRTGVDKSKMEALYPKVLADVTTITPVEQVRVKVKG